MSFRIAFRSILATALVVSATAVVAQEILVTGQRRGYNSGDASYSDGVVATSRPIINLRRNADYAVQTVRVTGDAREAETRRNDLRATIRNMIAAAAKADVELSTGDYVLAPLTLANYEDLNFVGDGRPDTDRATFLIKVRLTPGMTLKSASDRIAKFAASVPQVGRSRIVPQVGQPALSIVNPDQYRGQIIDLIAADAAISSGKFGSGSGVDVTGLDRPVEWARAGPTEVFLFLPASYIVRKR